MKKLLIPVFLLAITFISAGCGKDDSSPAAPAVADPNVLQDKIEGWNGETGDTLYLSFRGHLYSPSPIGADGSFSVKLPEESELQLRSVADYLGMNLNVSNTRTLMGSGSLLTKGGYNVYQSNMPIIFSSFNMIEGSYIITYWYFDRDCEISGIFEQAMGTGSLYYYYDIRGRKGWNKISTKVVRRNTQEVVMAVTGELPEGMKYYMMDH